MLKEVLRCIMEGDFLLLNLVSFFFYFCLETYTLSPGFLTTYTIPGPSEHQKGRQRGEIENLHFLPPPKRTLIKMKPTPGLANINKIYFKCLLLFFLSLAQKQRVERPGTTLSFVKRQKIQVNTR